MPTRRPGPAVQGSGVRPALPSLLSGEDLKFEAGSIMSAHGAKHASLRAAWQPLFFSGRRACRGSPVPLSKLGRGRDCFSQTTSVAPGSGERVLAPTFSVPEVWVQSSGRHHAGRGMSCQAQRG